MRVNFNIQISIQFEAQRQSSTFAIQICTCIFRNILPLTIKREQQTGVYECNESEKEKKNKKNQMAIKKQSVGIVFQLFDQKII